MSPTARVIIFAPLDDLHARAVGSALRRRQVRFETVDLQSLGAGTGLTLVAGHTSGAILQLGRGAQSSLSEAATIWWRRPQLPEPSKPRDSDRSRFVAGEWQQLVESLEYCTNARWINSPSATQRAGHKLAQLTAAQALGLRTPHTCITNDGDSVHHLAEEVQRVVFKKLGAGCCPPTVTRVLRPEDFDRLHTLSECPAIFQEYIEARLDIRVTAIGSELVAAEIESQLGSAPVDWRLDYTVPMRAHRLDEEVSSRLHALMCHLGLSYGAIDLRLTPEGEYVFLEVNPSGQFLFLELLAGLPLCERMADFLAQDVPSPSSSVGLREKRTTVDPQVWRLKE